MSKGSQLWQGPCCPTWHPHTPLHLEACLTLLHLEGCPTPLHGHAGPWSFKHPTGFSSDAAAASINPIERAKGPEAERTRCAPEGVALFR